MADTVISPQPKPAPYWWPDTRSIISLMLVGAVVGEPAVLHYLGPNAENAPILKETFDTIKTLATIAVGYWLGSSSASKSKDDTNQAQAQTIAAMAAPAAAAAAVVATNDAAETQAWADATKAGTPDAFNGYLAKFPAGVHAAEAKARLAALANP